MTRTIHVRPHERRKPGPSADFVAKTKALAAHVMAERELNAFVQRECVSALEASLASHFTPEELKRLRETY